MLKTQARETTTGSGIAYLLHRTGHYKVERIISMVNIGDSAAAVN